MNLLLRWVASAVAVGVAAYLLPGIRVEGGIQTLFVVALILGLANAVVRPLLKALSCGLIVLTLGLFLFVINAAMLWLTSLLARHLGYGFVVEDFTSALIGSVIVSVVSWLLSVVLTDDDD